MTAPGPFPHPEQLAHDINDTRAAIDTYADMLQWLRHHDLPQPTKAWLTERAAQAQADVVVLRDMARTFAGVVHP